MPKNEEEEAAAKKYRAAMSNGRGHLHEAMIEGACRAYREQGRAYIIKVPEPFRVITKNRKLVSRLFNLQPMPSLIIWG